MTEMWRKSFHLSTTIQIQQRLPKPSVPLRSMQVEHSSGLVLARMIRMRSFFSASVHVRNPGNCIRTRAKFSKVAFSGGDHLDVANPSRRSSACLECSRMRTASPPKSCAIRWLTCNPMLRVENLSHAPTSLPATRRRRALPLSASACARVSGIWNRRQFCALRARPVFADQRVPDGNLVCGRTRTRPIRSPPRCRGPVDRDRPRHT